MKYGTKVGNYSWVTRDGLFPRSRRAHAIDDISRPPLPSWGKILRDTETFHRGEGRNLFRIGFESYRRERRIHFLLLSTLYYDDPKNHHHDNNVAYVIPSSSPFVSVKRPTDSISRVNRFTPFLIFYPFKDLGMGLRYFCSSTRTMWISLTSFQRIVNVEIEAKNS